METKIEIPSGVEVSVNGKAVSVKGPKGSLERTFRYYRHDANVEIQKKDSAVLIRTAADRRKLKAYSGAIASHINNMIIGTTKGFVYKMKIFYTHFPISAEVKSGKVLVKNFLGERNIRTARIVGKTKVEVKKDEIILSGINIEDVSHTAANIERACRLSRKDRRIFLDGIYITEKAAVGE